MTNTLTPHVFFEYITFEYDINIIQQYYIIIKYLNLNKNTHSLVNRASLPPFHVVSIDQLLDVFTVMADALLSQMIEETFFHLRRYSKLSTSLFTSPEAQVIRFFSTSFFPTPLTITSKFETRRGACGGML